MTKVCELCFHTNRVMGVALEPYTMKLYTGSTVRTFYVMI